MINIKIINKGLVFLSANIINSAIPFLLMPLLTRILSPEDYGVVAMFSIFISLLNAFVGLSVHGAINVQYFKLSSNDFSEYVASCLMILAASGVVVFLVVFLLGVYFEDLIGIPYKWMLIAVVMSCFQFLATICLSIWVVSGAAIQYGVFQISQTMLNMVFSIILVVGVGLMWEGRLLGQVVVVFIFGIIALFIIYKSGYLKYPKNAIFYIKDALGFGIPLIPHAIGTFVIYSTDRVIISNLLDISTVGIYMVGIQLGQAMGLVCDSFNKVYAPWLMQNLSNKDLDREKVIAYSYVSMFAILSLGFLWALCLIYLLPFIVGDKFQESSKILIFMSLSFSMTGLYYIVTNYIFYARKTKYLAFITFFCGVINVPLTYFSVDKFGITGAAVSFLTIQVLFFLLTWILAYKVYPMPWFYFLKIRGG